MEEKKSGNDLNSDTMSDDRTENETIDESSIEQIDTNDEESSIPKDDTYYYGLFEAILFLSNDPVPISFFVKNFNLEFTKVKIILDSLIDDYEERSGGILLKEILNGYKFVTNNTFAEDIRIALFFNKKEGLSKGMLETLSIIAYKQPVILAEIDELRGVSSRMMLAKLMKMNLIKPIGRKELPGRPLLYGTTEDFLKHFGLNNLSDLPTISEIEEFYYENSE
jgi:segregation and condensation protein B